jgi:hypothetical protein
MDGGDTLQIYLRSVNILNKQLRLLIRDIPAVWKLGVRCYQYLAYYELSESATDLNCLEDYL